MFITVDKINEAEQKSKGKGKPWYELPVEYTNDKGAQQKKVFRSFDNQWTLGKSLVEGKTYDVKVEKVDNYWVWQSAVEADKDAMKNRQYTSSSGGSGGGGNSKYWDERLEFDKEKQALIIRQSVLSTAVAYLGLMESGVAEKITPEEVVEVAKKFEEYVYSRPDLQEVEVE